MTQPGSRAVHGRAHDGASRAGPDRDRAASAPAEAPERSARSRWGLPVIGLLVLLLALPPLLALGLASTRTPVHGARAELIYRVPPDSQRFDQEIQTQVLVLGSRGFLQPTAAAFDMPTEQLQEALTAEQVDGSELLRVTVSNTDAERALALVKSITESYTKRLTGGSTLDDQSQALQRRLDRLHAREERVNNRLSKVTARDARRAAANDKRPEASASQLRLEGVAVSLRDQLSELERRMTDYRLRELEGGPTVEVVAAPYVLDDPVSPQPLRSLAAGLLIGIILAGSALVGLRARAGRRAQDADLGP